MGNIDQYRRLDLSFDRMPVGFGCQIFVLGKLYPGTTRAALLGTAFLPLGQAATIFNFRDQSQAAGRIDFVAKRVAPGDHRGKSIQNSIDSNSINDPAPARAACSCHAVSGSSLLK